MRKYFAVILDFICIDFERVEAQMLVETDVACCPNELSACLTRKWYKLQWWPCMD